MMTAGLLGVGWVVWEEKSGGKTGVCSEKATSRSLKEEGAEKNHYVVTWLRRIEMPKRFKNSSFFEKKFFCPALSTCSNRYRLGLVLFFFDILSSAH
jgi:hypothetical protein